MIILKEIKCTYEVYEKYCKAFQEMKDKAGSYTPTENEIYQRMLFIMDANGKNQKALTTDAKSETDAAWID